MRTELLESFAKSKLINAANARLLEAASSLSISEASPSWSFEDNDRHNWYMMGAVAGEPTVGGVLSKDITVEGARRIREQAHLLFYTNPFARGVIRTFRKFIFGKGATFVLLEDKDTRKKAAQEYLDEWHDVNGWDVLEKELCDRVFRDGEGFLFNRKMGKKSVPRVEFIEPDDVDSNDANVAVTHGIEKDPKDPTRVLWYYVKKTDAGGKVTTNKISGDDIIHVKINVDRNVKRGRSIFEPVFKYMSYHEDWLKDRVVLNKVRNAIALVRHLDNATRTEGLAIRDQTKDVSNPNRTKRAQAFRPGTIINAGPGVRYEMLSANLGASDAAQDGRNILLAIAVGIGFPEMFLTGNFENANYSSSLTAQNPFVREFEDWQDYLGYYLRILIRNVLQEGINNGMLNKATSVKVKVDWPPLRYEDLVAMTQALGQLFLNEVISKHTYATRLGFDYEEEKEMREKEAADEAEAGGDEFGGFPGEEEPTPPEGGEGEEEEFPGEEEPEEESVRERAGAGSSTQGKSKKAKRKRKPINKKAKKSAPVKRY
jgi:hypothetical protein